MRCKKHPSDVSSTNGVCATCLRERLVFLIAAQARAQQQAQYSLAEDHPRKSDSHPPPLVFPRSVSPYVSRRKSSDTTWCNHSGEDHNHHHHRHRHQRFYSTPQVGPTYSSNSNTTTFVIAGTAGRKQRSKFSLWSRLFRSRSEKFGSDPRVPSHELCEPSSSTSSSSPSWFSSILFGRKKKQPNHFYLEESVSAAGRRQCRMIDRGMSPERADDSEGNYEAGERSPSGTRYSPDSSPKWWRSPAVAPGSARRGRTGHSRNVSGLAFCLSPLVRASPNRHWNQKGLPPEISSSGDARASGKPHLSTAASFCANRSRKIADFGRAPNR